MSGLRRLTRTIPEALRSANPQCAHVRPASLVRLQCIPRSFRPFGSASIRQQGAQGLPELTKAEDVQSIPAQERSLQFAGALPVACPGCGALSQTIEPDAAGFYSPKKRNLRKTSKENEDAIFRQAMARINPTDGKTSPSVEPSSTGGPQICDRCHDLLYQSKGSSIVHPSMQSIQDIIESSPHKSNHIYHVLDAADFPLSLIPNLMSTLKLPRLRTQNRRSKTKQYIRGRAADVSFIITRSDLLAPQKEQVDRLMPYLQDVLRDALGRTGRDVRLGNVRCVSAKRGWWTPNVKQEIWERGGAGWVVGKVNVGKSALFEVVYPKGKNTVPLEDARTRALRESGAAQHLLEDAREARTAVTDAENIALSNIHSDDPVLEDLNSALQEDAVSELATAKENLEDSMIHSEAAQQQTEDNDVEINEEDDIDEDDISLLPPAQPEMQYPHMPVVSALPGTTASPIRIPFGNGKGELIDLPGVQRSSLETHVLPEHHPSLVMKSRVVPEQHTLKPGQSLLLGGIIRITPKTDDLVVLAYPFTPLKPHVSGNEKAMAIQTGNFEDGTAYTGTVQNIGTEKAKSRIKSAGVFALQWDVTKRRAGPVTDKTAGKQKAEDLPYVVYGADLLIEGVGWVELVCQVRNRRKSLVPDALSDPFGEDGKGAELAPEIEVFTPKGKFIGVRKPMNAWLLGGPKKVAKHAQKPRPRMTISIQKRKAGGTKGDRSIKVAVD